MKNNRSIKNNLFPFLFVLLLTFAANNSLAQQGRDHIKFPKQPAIKVTAGDSITVVIKAKIDKYWHTYGLKRVVGPDGFGPEPTVVTLKKSDYARTIGRVTSSKGHVKFDSTWGAKVEDLDGNVEFMIPVRISQKLKVGTYKLDVKVEFQMCDTASCLAPDDVLVPVEITVIKEADANAAPIVDVEVDNNETPSGDGEIDSSVGQNGVLGTSSGTAAIDSRSEIGDETDKGLWSFFLYAMGVGFLALLTPCVFPMIPITVSFFTKRSEKNRARSLRDALLFAVGIISTFTIIGVLASLIFGESALQDLSANGYMNLGIGLLFILLAFNLFGAFEIQVPVSILNKLNKKSQGSGIAAVFLMGFTFSLTSFTCTAPFVSTALTLTAKEGVSLAPMVGMLGFSSAFALPFFFLALFPSLLVALPRAGGWMNNMKVVMGFLEIAAAVKFISTAEFVWNWGVLPREPFLAIWAAVCLLIALYILGVFHMKLDSAVERVSALRAVFAIMFVTMSMWFMAGMLGKPLPADLEALLPPDNYHEIINGTVGASPNSAGLNILGSKEKTDELVWLSNLDEGKALAKKENKPLFIDFTGFACVNCRWMEKFMFPKESVRSRFKKMVLVQLYTDRKTEPYVTNQNIMKTFGSVANPMYVLLAADGSYIAQKGYTRDEALFLSFIDQALQ